MLFARIRARDDPPAPHPIGPCRGPAPCFRCRSRPGAQARGRRLPLLDADGRAVRDRATLARIRALAIPPAWTDVWICPRARRPHPGDRPRRPRPQAVPLPPALARGPRRDQVRPHGRLRRARCRASARRVRRATWRCPACRARRCWPRSCACWRRRSSASATRSTRATNGSFGLTTLRDRHAQVNGATVRFRFRGKSGVEHAIELRRPAPGRASCKRCQDLPGPGAVPVRRRRRRARTPSTRPTSTTTSARSPATTSPAKDFRTWAGTVLAARRARRGRRVRLARRRRSSNVDAAIEAVAAPARQHPGRLPQVLRPPGRDRRLPGGPAAGRAAQRCRGHRPAQKEEAAQRFADAAPEALHFDFAPP